ncbi:MAG: peptide ABC transporter substrate-binding protein [Robiginitomaculum sp.]|nr:MAG: peptide ABC transporter substrate-binding protein [Robiginitomaculum sp.]
MSYVSRFTLAAFAASVLVLSGCGGGNKPADEGLTLHRGNAAEPLSLDPHQASGTWENNIIGDMFIGLFTENATGEPVPGMAENWITSEDGKTWTFTLREASWSDGFPVTANDFVYSLRRILNPETLAQYASLLFSIKNAEAINSGKMPVDELGVRAIDEHTLEIKLEYPAPYLPGLLSHYTSMPVPAHIVKEKGSAWIKPENIVVNGPYKLVEWRTNDYVHSTKNPLFFDAKNVCLDDIFYYPTVDNNSAERQVREGRLDLNNDFPGQKLEFLNKQLPGYVRVHPYLGTTYFSLNTRKAPFNDKRVRNALGMALDRDFMTSEILKSGQIPAYSLVPPGVANYPKGASVKWANLSLEERKKKARELLMEAGYGPDHPLTFEYIYRNTRDNPRIAPAVQADWNDIAPWVNVTITGTETQILYANLRAGEFEASDGAWIADYNDAQNFLYLMETRTGQMNYSKYSNAEYDALVDQSNKELDMEKRAALMRKAEQIMLDDMPVIPMWYEVNRALVSPKVTGWVDNIVDIHRSRYLCIDRSDDK